MNMFNEKISEYRIPCSVSQQNGSLVCQKTSGSGVTEEVNVGRMIHGVTDRPRE